MNTADNCIVHFTSIMNISSPNLQSMLYVWDLDTSYYCIHWCKIPIVHRYFLCIWGGGRYTFRFNVGLSGCWWLESYLIFLDLSSVAWKTDDKRWWWWIIPFSGASKQTSTITDCWAKSCHRLKRAWSVTISVRFATYVKLNWNFGQLTFASCLICSFLLRYSNSTVLRFDLCCSF